VSSSYKISIVFLQL